jgi:hypothetical protein
MDLGGFSETGTLGPDLHWFTGGRPEKTLESRLTKMTSEMLFPLGGSEYVSPLASPTE